MEKELKELEKELEPIVLAATFGDFSNPGTIDADNEDSLLLGLRGSIKLLVDGFHEQYLEMEESRKEILLLNQSYLESLRKLEEFTYVASHDIRRPLTNMESLLKISDKIQDEEAKSEVNSKIEQSVKELGDKLDALISVISGSQKNINSRNIDIKQWSAELNNHLLELNPEASYSSEIKILSFNWDLDKLNTIFRELTANAVAFSGRDTDLEIQVTINPNEDGSIEIVFCDNGKGLELPENEDFLFRMFSKSSSSKGRGIGMGLIKNVLDHTEGKIKVETNNSSGLKYTITLKEV